ncbi:PIN domain-like protein [Schizophyllum amplum]|uniref:PIN domain-like protein n=1 Tax=Schizophyllum amplum TaxID=97359 RepID=A0A550BU11_9AGAR|nr:PIN domain-like protein [Auriculariopsis ampla]
MAVILKLCIQLLGLPTETVMVFDGAPTPRQQKATARSLEIMHFMKSLAEAFGFMVHNAPADGQAELAYLNIENMVNVVFAVDSGVVLFGARLIVRSVGAKNRDTVTVYRRKDMEAMGLRQAGLPAFALLCGSQYGPKASWSLLLQRPWMLTPSS